jgi:hypothetical protein
MYDKTRVTKFAPLACLDFVHLLWCSGKPIPCVKQTQVLLREFLGIQTNVSLINLRVFAVKKQMEPYA